jgi:hypothetical protein
MNIFNLKRQVAGYMLMCGGGGAGGGGSGSSGGDSGVGDSGRWSAGGSNAGGFDQFGDPVTAAPADDNSYQSNNGSPMYGADSVSENQPSYQSNDGQPMYGKESAPSEASAQTGISAGGDYSGYTTGSDANNNATPVQDRSINSLTDDEKTAQSVVKKMPILGQLYSGVEGFGKFIQPGGSTMQRGDTPGSAGGNGGNFIDEDGNSTQKSDKKGLINSSIQDSSKNLIQAIQQNTQVQQPPQNSPQAAVPAYAGGSVDASMYGDGSGWGASITKFAKAKQGEKL